MTVILKHMFTRAELLVRNLEFVSSLPGLSLDVHLSVTSVLPFILQESCGSISEGYCFGFCKGLFSRVLI